MRVQITTRRCEVPEPVLERAREQVESLARFHGGASSAELVFEEENVTRRAEVRVHIAGAPPVVATGEASDFLAAVDQVVDRAGRMLREQRKKERDHKAPPLSEQTPAE